MNMFLLFVIFFQFASVDCLADDEQELLLVQAVWRHGDRSPAETFKTDRYQEQDWPQGWGQLSPVGMRQHVRLGQKLRRRYIQDLQLVSPHYNSHEIYVRSTDSNRTLISAISNLIGFYGPGTAEEYPQGLEADWPGAYVPIAVHTLPGREDFGAPNKRDCPRHRELKAAMWRTPEVQRATEEHKWLLDLLTEKTGEPIDVFRLWMVAEAFEIEMTNKRPLVDWAEGNQTLLDAIKLLNNREVNWINGLDLSPVDGIDFRLEVPRIRGGPILWKMIGNMRDKLRCQQKMHAEREGDREIEGKQSPLGAPLCKWMNRLKYIVYSAHDSTLASLFSALGFPKSNYDRDGIPEYSACLTMELWRSKSSGHHSVKLLLWPPDSEETTSFIDVTRDVRGCDNDGGCTLEQFAQRSEPYKMLPSPEEYCQTSLTTTTSSSTSPSTKPNTPANSSADPLRLHRWKFTMICWLAVLLSMLCAL